MGLLTIKKLNDLVQEFLVERYYAPVKGRSPEKFPVRFFEDGVADLNRSFTSERGELPRNYFNLKELRSGYIAYFLLVNALKVPALLKEIPASFWKRDKLKVLDFGSGPGTGVLGTMLAVGALPEAPLLQFTAIDQSLPILKDALAFHQKMRSHFPFSSSLHTKPADFVREPLPKILGHERFDLILILNAFNEQFTMEKRVQILKRLTQHHLSEGGMILIMEPALRKTSRELMELHDAIIGKDGPALHVLAPCPHQYACPMLKESGRDWCHTYIEWERPWIIEAFDKRVGIRKDYLKCSYLLLSSAPSSPPFGEGIRGEGGDKWRAVSSLMKEAGKAKVVLCGEEAAKNGKLLHTERLSKDRSESNYQFDQIKRGDLLETAPKSRIEKSDKISIS